MWSLGQSFWKNITLPLTVGLFLKRSIMEKGFAIDSELSTRIVGGKPIPISKAPYAVALVDDRGQNFCTGTLISPCWVVTAAHCASNGITPTHIRVNSSSGSDGGELYRVEKILKHPYYRSNSKNWDCALIKLSDNVAFSDTVKAATLPEPNDHCPVGTMFTVSGYGATKSFRDSCYPFKNKLRSVNVPVVGQNYCQLAFPGRISEEMMCAGYPEGGKDACHGDSGGPGIDGDKLVGIVSWGKGCGLPNFPGVYVRVSAVREWIREVTGI